MTVVFKLLCRATICSALFSSFFVGALFDRLGSAAATGRLVIRLAELLADHMTLDVVLKDGDQLIVPRLRQEVTALGEVQFAKPHIFWAQLKREDYIGRSGGITARAEQKRIYVVRANGWVVEYSGARWFRRASGVDI